MCNGHQLRPLLLILFSHHLDLALRVRRVLGGLRLAPKGQEIHQRPGGLRIITEQVPGVRSVAFGIWVSVGSRDESAAQMGSAHYLEHLLFKGTSRRSALDISASIEAVGGDLNAFTTKEYTCYYARVLDVDLPLAIDVVSDVVNDALIRHDDVEAERGVILEEIAMHDDDPSDVVHDDFAAVLFEGSALGRPSRRKNEPGIRPSEYMRSSTSTVRGKKSN